LSVHLERNNYDEVATGSEDGQDHDDEGHEEDLEGGHIMDILRVKDCRVVILAESETLVVCYVCHGFCGTGKKLGFLYVVSNTN